MINRSMVRTHIVQTLYAHYGKGDETNISARKALDRSFTSTYNLYLLSLDFVNELTRYAEEQMHERQQRAKATHTTFATSTNFIANRLAVQLFNNRELRRLLDENKLGWDAGLSGVRSVMSHLEAADIYQTYMGVETPTYEQDNILWRKILQDLLVSDDEFLNALEEMEIHLDGHNWEDELDTVLSFAIKTIKRFKEETTPDQPLLPMFDNEDELKFAHELLQYALEGHDEYQELIAKHLKRWEADRIAVMDKIILQTALAELFRCPNIAIEVTMNEYIELAKNYSTDKSYLFVNGILDEIIREKKDEGLLRLKAAALRNK